MPFDAAKAKEKILETSVVYAGETLHFGFKQTEMSPEWFELQERYGDENDYESLADLMCGVMTHWDMTEDGEPVSLNKENLSRYIDELGLPFAGVINRKMQEMSVDEKGEVAKRRRRG